MQSSRNLLSALAVAALLLGCAQGGSGAAAGTSNLLADAVASATSAGGTLLCAPSQGQVDACTGKAAGDACALASPDGAVSVAGTCRATLDGSEVACAPTPPAPPQALVDACTGLAVGAACTAAEPDGEVHTGVCVTARDGVTVLCGRQHSPPRVAIDACAAKAAGDACTMTGHADGTPVTGVCGLGPAGTGVLACAPPQALRPSATSACTGLAAGAACTLDRGRHDVAGTCVTPAAGGDPVCQAACADLGGRFCPGGRGPGHEPPPPQAAVDACATLAAGAACTMTGPDGVTAVAGVCRSEMGVVACAVPMAHGR